MKPRIVSMEECREFRQFVLARPSPATRNTMFLAILLLTSTVIWASICESPRTVDGAGRLRPIGGVRSVVLERALGALSGSAAAIPARVVEVHFAQGDEVEAGAPLLRLDSIELSQRLETERAAESTLRERIQRARRANELAEREFEAELGNLHAKITSAKQRETRRREDNAAELGAARTALVAAEAYATSLDTRTKAERKLAETRLHAACQRHDRVAQLVDSGIRSGEEFELVQLELRSAERDVEASRSPIELLEVEARVTALRARLRKAELADRNRSDDMLILRSELDVVEATHQRTAEQRFAAHSELEIQILEISSRIATLEADLTSTVVTAPESGVITTEPPRVGDFLAADHPVAEIAVGNALELRVRVSAADVGELEIGMPARVQIDAYDHRRFGALSGRIAFIEPDSAPMDGVSGAAGFEVRVAFDASDPAITRFPGPVRLGLSGNARIALSTQSLLSRLLRRVSGAG